MGIWKRYKANVQDKMRNISHKSSWIRLWERDFTCPCPLMPVSGRWTVGLSEIVYPHTWYNLPPHLAYVELNKNTDGLHFWSKLKNWLFYIRNQPSASWWSWIYFQLRWRNFLSRIRSTTKFNLCLPLPTGALSSSLSPETMRSSWILAIPCCTSA